MIFLQNNLKECVFAIHLLAEEQLPNINKELVKVWPKSASKSFERIGETESEELVPLHLIGNKLTGPTWLGTHTHTHKFIQRVGIGNKHSVTIIKIIPWTVLSLPWFYIFPSVLGSTYAANIERLHWCSYLWVTSPVYTTHSTVYALCLTRLLIDYKGNK